MARMHTHSRGQSHSTRPVSKRPPPWCQYSPEEVEAETRRIVEEGKKVDGYMFCSGEMVPRETPEENMRAAIEAAVEFGKY